MTARVPDDLRERSVQGKVMPKAETLLRLKEVIRACLKVEAQTPMPDTMPLVGGEYDLDSLDILLIVTEIEKAFDIKIHEGAMNKAAFTNIETLAAFIEGLPQAGHVGGS